MRQFNKEELFKDVPDKREYKNTTSLKFKEDLIEFFGDEANAELNCLEIGMCRGHTTRILSYLFKKVDTCEIEAKHIEFAEKLNADRDNISIYEYNVYSSERWPFSNVDVCFIDCVHMYDFVRSDIYNALKVGNRPMYLVFDDYGLLPDTKRAVDDVAAQHNLEHVRYLGEPKGSDCRPGKELLDWEGIILKVNP